MTDLEAARERLRVAVDDEVEAQRVWNEARVARRVANRHEDASMHALLEARERMRDSRAAVVKLERQ